jgi:hypothetical protein
MILEGPVKGIKVVYGNFQSEIISVGYPASQEKLEELAKELQAGCVAWNGGGSRYSMADPDEIKLVYVVYVKGKVTYQLPIPVRTYNCLNEISQQLLPYLNYSSHEEPEAKTAAV